MGLINTKNLYLMISKHFSLLALSTLLLSGCFLASCRKDSLDADIEAAENNAISESTFNDITTLVDQSVSSGNVLLGVNGGSSATGDLAGLGSDCATVTLDTVSSTRSVTIDFGTTNCLCKDGRNRRGKIIATYTGRYRSSGTVITISFGNYFVNDNQVKGTKKITNNGTNNAGHLVYSVEVIGQIIKANNGGTISWNSTRQREWTAGENTPLILTDDTYSITGSASGTNASGLSYTINIIQPLVRTMSCRWFESGQLEVTPEGKATRTLDYGNSGCDANATVTILNKTYPIVLR
jgi:hypothetical protein